MSEEKEVVEEKAKKAPAKKRGRPSKADKAKAEAEIAANMEVVVEAEIPVEEASEVAVCEAKLPTDWKALVPKRDIDLSEDWCRANGIEKSTLTREQIEEKLEEVGDEAKIILLSGFKAVAKIRGLESISFDVVRTGNGDDKYAVIKCCLRFTPMDGEVLYAEGLANATEKNTSYPFDMYLESMAENRALIRAVRHALNINIVGYEEIHGKVGASVETAGLDDDGGTLSPQATLRSIVESKNKTLGDLQNYLKKHDIDTSSYSDFDDIPSDVCFEIVDVIQKQGK